MIIINTPKYHQKNAFGNHIKKIKNTNIKHDIYLQGKSDFRPDRTTADILWIHKCPMAVEIRKPKQKYHELTN